jgi:hypothetical protein
MHIANHWLSWHLKIRIGIAIRALALTLIASTTSAPAAANTARAIATGF